MPVRLEFTEDEAGRAAYITMDREAKLNALDWSQLEALLESVKSLGEDDRLRVVVITGAGDRAFTAGADLNVLRQHTPETARAFITLIHEVNSGLRQLPAPVICKINGHCIGAGLEVAVSCDMRVAVDTAQFSMPEVQVGLPSVIEAALLPRLIGWGRTGELLYTGTPIDAQTALDWGLVEKICPREELDNVVDTRVQAILRAAPLAVRAQKRLMNEWAVLPLEQAVSRGIDYLSEAYQTTEPAEAIKKLQAARRT